MNRGNTTTKQAVTAIHPRHDDPCPCDSGEKFKHCCAKQKIRWQRNTDGTWTKCVPLVPEAQAIIRQERREFLEMFGREPGEGDYLFFRMNAMTTTEEIGRQMDVAIDKAGIRPDIAYATKKTGLLLTKENAGFATGKDLREWDEAIDEYWGVIVHKKPKKPSAFDRAAVAVIVEYERVMIALGAVGRMGGPPRYDVSSEGALAHTMFCTTRAIRSLRAIKLLTDQYFGEDGLALVRSVYECYLNVAYLLPDLARADDLFWARLGLLAGTHRYATRPNGRVDWTKIIEQKTGKVLAGTISFRDMARLSFREADLPVYEDLYSFLSTHTHPDAVNLEHYTDKHGYDHTGSVGFFEARVLGLFVALFLVDAICASGFVSERFQKDLDFYGTRTKKVLSDVIRIVMPDPLRVSFSSRLGACLTGK